MLGPVVSGHPHPLSEKHRKTQAKLTSLLCHFTNESSRVLQKSNHPCCVFTTSSSPFIPEFGESTRELSHVWLVDLIGIEELTMSCRL